MQTEPSARFGDEGVSMVVIVLSLLVPAILTALLVGTMFNSNSGANSSTSVTNAPGVAMATNIQAQQNLSAGPDRCRRRRGSARAGTPPSMPRRCRLRIPR